MKRLSSFVLTISIFVFLTSCSSSIPCANTDFQDSKNNLRAFGQAHSSREELAKEMAIIDAKQKLGEKLSAYIEENFKNQTLVEDEGYEQALRIAQKTIMRDIAIICSSTKKQKGVYYAYVGLDIEVKNMESVIKKTKLQIEDR
ncbi:MAG: hypothetical protein GX879_04000 [Bacteroidales bacterium]|nr:hypothetical protein [Bacteroidales bacterium]